MPRKASPKCIEFRIELYCGSSEESKTRGVDAAEKRYFKADHIASLFNIPTYFEQSYQHGIIYCDGYIYPNNQNIFRVLALLKKYDVEFDNIDIPLKLKGSDIHKRLVKMFPPRSGVSVNVGGIEMRSCHKRISRFEGF